MFPSLVTMAIESKLIQLLPPDYGYVMFVGVGSTFVNMWLAINVSRARGRYNIPVSQDCILHDCAIKLFAFYINISLYYFLLSANRCLWFAGMYLSIRSRVNYPLIFEIYAPPFHCTVCPTYAYLYLIFIIKHGQSSSIIVFLSQPRYWDLTLLCTFRTSAHYMKTMTSRMNGHWCKLNAFCFSGTDHVQSRERSV